MVVERDGVAYLADFGGPEDALRVMGWYYGYPACCIDAFVELAKRYLAGEQQDPQPHHPVSGHVLCAACAAGPLAPLPDRPAERYGFVFSPGDPDNEEWEPPSPHSPCGEGW